MGNRNRKLIFSFGKDTKAVLDFAKQAKKAVLTRPGRIGVRSSHLTVKTWHRSRAYTQSKLNAQEENNSI